MCKSARRTHGTAARSVPVAEMLASEAPHAPPEAKHYVLKREMATLRTNANFELEICVKARGGRLALQNGRPLSLI